MGRLLIAHELAKSAAIAGNEELAKEAKEAYAAGQLAGHLLREKVAEAAKPAATPEPEPASAPAPAPAPAAAT